eukprot:gene10171-13683_t
MLKDGDSVLAKRKFHQQPVDENPRRPTNSLVSPMLTDMYQISMTYSYWKHNKQDDHAVFDLFYRKCPFGGAFCVFGGLDEVLTLLASFKFTDDDIEYLKSLLPNAEDIFFTWLEGLDCSKVKAYSMEEGTLVFPREPLFRVEGPLAIVQLLETTMLNLVNFPSLIATNAARMRLAAGPGKTLLEFGLRRAQGPDGGISASKYAYLGGFDGTSNVLAGKLFGIHVSGTHAHSFVMSYIGLEDIKVTTIVSPTNPNEQVEFVKVVLEKRKQLKYTATNDGELAAFISYAQSFPNGFLALVDTYDTLESGVLNFVLVGLALHELGYKPVGIRLDSGDLGYLSTQARQIFRKVDELWTNTNVFSSCKISASNDLNEEVILALNRQGHEIDMFGIGTHLVTCQKQPALGCVFKLVAINGLPRIKISQDAEKILIPGCKNIFRLYGSDGHALADVMQLSDEPDLIEKQNILIRHPFQPSKRAEVTPKHVKKLLNCVFDGPQGYIQAKVPLVQSREHCLKQLQEMRPDHIRLSGAVEYKVSVSQHLYDHMQVLWEKEAPITHLE